MSDTTFRLTVGLELSDNESAALIAGRLPRCIRPDTR